MKNRMLIAALSLSVLSGFAAAEVAPFERAEPALVAEGEDAESAHTIRKACNRRDSSPWGWRITFYKATRYKGKIYVTHWHDPKWYNVTGRFHTNISSCEWWEMEPKYIPSPR